MRLVNILVEGRVGPIVRDPFLFFLFWLLGRGQRQLVNLFDCWNVLHRPLTAKVTLVFAVTLSWYFLDGFFGDLKRHRLFHFIDVFDHWVCLAHCGRHLWLRCPDDDRIRPHIHFL